MIFLDPALLVLLCLVPAFAGFFLWRNTARAQALRRIGDDELVKRLAVHISPGLRRMKQMLWLFCLAVLVVALARPAWGLEQTPVLKQGVAVMVVVDVSLSMTAQDVVPSRLERARLDLQTLLQALEGNDAGIVLFAGQPFTYMPLTYDMQAAQVFARSIVPEAVPVPGTAIAEALQSALAALAEVAGESRVIVLLSDGENHEGSLTAAAKAAREAGVIIHTVGYGTASGAAIPLFDSTGALIEYKRDAQGRLVQTRLDEETLLSLAQATGGLYQLVRDGSEINRIIEAVRALEPDDLGEEWLERPIERFGIFAALALLALSVEMLLPETWRRRL